MSDLEPSVDDIPISTARRLERPAKGRRSFETVARELNDKELSGPVVQKMLLDEVERLEGELSQARLYQEKFHEADKKASVLEERLQKDASYEVLYNSCVIGGSVLLGFAPTVWSDQPLGAFTVIVGAIAVIGGLWSKKVRS